DETVLTGSISTAATNASNAGNYAITSNYTASNYDITINDGTLIILPVELEDIIDSSNNIISKAIQLKAPLNNNNNNNNYNNTVIELINNNIKEVDNTVIIPNNRIDNTYDTSISSNIQYYNKNNITQNTYNKNIYDLVIRSNEYSYSNNHIKNIYNSGFNNNNEHDLIFSSTYNKSLQLIKDADGEIKIVIVKTSQNNNKDNDISGAINNSNNTDKLIDYSFIESFFKDEEKKLHKNN
ncbi:MAG: MBG domain-containing protein, partial [Cyanobacteriota bacterium]